MEVVMLCSNESPTRAVPHDAPESGEVELPHVRGILPRAAPTFLALVDQANSSKETGF